MLVENYDTSKIFIWNNTFNKASYTNAGGAPVTLAAGTLMGRITASKLVIPLVAAATDGSQQPLGVLKESYVVPAGATVTVYFCDGGQIVKNKIILNGAETLETVVTGVGTIGDLIGRNTTIKMVDSVELSGFDNQ